MPGVKASAPRNLQASFGGVRSINNQLKLRANDIITKAKKEYQCKLMPIEKMKVKKLGATSGKGLN